MPTQTTYIVVVDTPKPLELLEKETGWSFSEQLRLNTTVLDNVDDIRQSGKFTLEIKAGRSDQLKWLRDACLLTWSQCKRSWDDDTNPFDITPQSMRLPILNRPINYATVLIFTTDASGTDVDDAVVLRKVWIDDMGGDLIWLSGDIDSDDNADTDYYKTIAKGILDVTTSAETPIEPPMYHACLFRTPSCFDTRNCDRAVFSDIINTMCDVVEISNTDAQLVTVKLQLKSEYKSKFNTAVSLLNTWMCRTAGITSNDLGTDPSLSEVIARSGKNGSLDFSAIALFSKERDAVNWAVMLDYVSVKSISSDGTICLSGYVVEKNTRNLHIVIDRVLPLPKE